MHTRPDVPDARQLILIGGGHAHVTVLRQLGMRPEPGLRVSLITRDLLTPYSGMLPGLIAGHYQHQQTHIDLARLARFAGAQLIHAEVQALDPDTQTIHIPERPPLRYDLASINTGSTPKADTIPGAQQHALAVKPIDHFLQGWDDIQQQAQQQTQQGHHYHLSIVGGGAGGVELALAIAHRLRPNTGPALHIHLISASDHLLPEHNPGVRQRLQQALAQAQIKTTLGDRVSRIEANSVHCQSGQQHPSNATLLLTQASAPRWAKNSGLNCDPQGFIRVNQKLQSPSHPNIFAVGDIAHLIGQERAKSGVFAVRQGPILSDNLRRHHRGQTLRRYRAQSHFLGLISLGGKQAIASRGQLALGGRWSAPLLWAIKDRIDRAFMRRYQHLPAMDSAAPQHPSQQDPALDSSAMRCAGCGAKIGASILKRCLDKLPQAPESPDIDYRQGDDAAVIQPPPGQALIQSLDAFRAFTDDPYLLGQIACEHALNDLYAMGATPHSALLLANIPHAADALVEEQLYQLLAGVQQRLNQAGARLIGGHSAEAQELAIGLNVNGFAAREQLWQKSQAQAGDHILLTKAIGSGTLLAADMRAQAQAPWIKAAYDNMLNSNRQAATILRQHPTHACTDLTGFGLIGHLAEISQASGHSIHLHPQALPILPGAKHCLQQGIESSLSPQNRQSACSVQGLETLEPWLNALLFDPQTAGGLIATLPPQAAETALQQLQDNGYPHARCIGQIGKPSGHSAEIQLSTTIKQPSNQ